MKLYSCYVRSLAVPDQLDNSFFVRETSFPVSSFSDFIKSTFYALIRVSHYKKYSIFCNGSLVGYFYMTSMSYRYSFMSRKDLEVGNVFISSDFRNKKIAKRFLYYVLNQYPPDSLLFYIVDEENYPSIRLAQSLGFSLHGSVVKKFSFPFSPYILL